MPRIPDSLLDCAIYLYESVDDARKRTKACGSGFLYAIMISETEAFIYAISNWHVVTRAPVVRLNTKAGDFDVLSFATTEWTRNPDNETDLAAIPLAFSHRNHRFSPVRSTEILTAERISALGIGIGDDIFAVGRFINREGEQRNEPTVRFGILAQMPGDPIQTDVGSQEAYLGEIRSISGYSGSPVFALAPSRRDPEFLAKIHPGDTPVSQWLRKMMVDNILDMGGESVFFLGIDCAHLHSYEQVLDDHRTPTGMVPKSNTGMAIIIPAWKLTELLEVKTLKKQRSELLDARAKNANG